MFFLLLSCDGVIFDTRLMLLGYSRLETLENIMNSERPYSGLNFELACPQRNANWRGKWYFRWGRRAKVNDLKSEVIFCMLFARDQ